MLAQIRDLLSLRAASVALFALTSIALSSCATKQETVLVSDPAAGPESSLPWNQQQKWEGQGQFGGMADRMQGSRGRY